MPTQDLYYLAVPYHGTDQEKAYRTELSLKAATVFLQHVIHVFAPVIYVNQIAKQMDFSGQDERRNVIMPYLHSFLRVSKGMILVTTDGWDSSWGVMQELEFCAENHIPVYMISPEDLSGDVSMVLLEPIDVGDIRPILSA